MPESTLVVEELLPINKLDLNVILNMSAGPEMDALVAKEVMGYSVDFEERPSVAGEAKRVWFIVAGENQLHRSKIPEFSTRMEDAWNVGKKMQSRGHALSLQHRNMIENAPGTAIWTAWFGRANDLAWAATPSLALCRAALAALRSNEERVTEAVAGPVFSIIEHELARIMGPIAPIMVNDKIAEFGQSRDRFPEDRLDSLLKALGEEIGDDEGREAFAAAMTELILPKRWSSKSKDPELVEENPFSIIERELARIMGPIAPIMMNDKIAEFGESRNGFPEDRLDSFWKELADEIRDDAARAIFETVMTDYFSRRLKS